MDTGEQGGRKGAAQAAGILPVVTRLLRPLAAKCPKVAITFAPEGVNSGSWDNTDLEAPGQVHGVSRIRPDRAIVWTAETTCARFAFAMDCRIPRLGG